MIPVFIDGDFPTNKGCKYHCSPSCHPGQVDENKWHYGCTHPAWPQNREESWVPFVECDADKGKCDLKKEVKYWQESIDLFNKETE